jgi:hypothetical protein
MNNAPVSLFRFELWHGQELDYRVFGPVALDLFCLVVFVLDIDVTIGFFLFVVVFVLEIVTENAS